MPEPARREGSPLSPKAIAAMVLVAVVVIFIFENTKKTKIRFLIPEVTAPLWTALLGAAALGVIAGWLLARRD